MRDGVASKEIDNVFGKVEILLESGTTRLQAEIMPTLNRVVPDSEKLLQLLTTHDAIGRKDGTTGLTRQDGAQQSLQILILCWRRSHARA